ncbi:TPA: glycosyltransferase, partial [Streptococcus suis]|nr:glycosyltransferase [Streptococcus suis]HEL2597601.1 glycosyltransferase [Streptococcus suis]
MNTPLISVIVPVYNVEGYIEQCIRSIQSQTYKNLEVIIVDDGSPDNSIVKAKSLTDGDPRFIYIQQENGGLSAARNTG